MQQESAYHVNESRRQEESRWIEKAKEDPRFFEPLYSRYYEPILQFIYKRVGEKESAYDICSMTFLKALNHLKSFKSMEVPFASWLYRIALNEVYDAYRKQKTQWTVSLDTLQLKEMADEILEDDFEQKLALIKKILAELSQEEISFIEMRFFEKRSFREVSEILNITETNAKVKMHRIIEKIKKRINEKVGS